ncbi:hypothetical protein [Merismopedia glauca]|uniref:Uncharacterized protein n=1 Tax=Merismopedia glauca CCAP 1448/3 TaxID=1296344 RepID=A0A2T1C5E0_9CYAN|nr:hypothetical protein [Merismopedia glauca]PSB03444.1 hypothetical protein C7B64_08515 [Merismopedia glauca CCAP 1448/3]
MKSGIFLGSVLSLASTLAIATPGLTANSPAELLRKPPNNSFPVSVKSGKCPKNVKLWTHVRAYEGGGEWTVIADTLAIASPATLVSGNKKVAVFRATLKPAFKSCRGVAVSSEEDLNLYKFEFQGGRVIFRVNLPKDTPSNPSAIVQARRIKGRPLVRWAIAD